MRERTFTTMLSIALRNLSRHRVKTIITATAVAVSVCLYIAADGWLHGMNLESRRNIVSYEIGAAKIQTKAYFEKKDDLPMYEAFSGWEGLSESLSRAGYDSAPRFVFSGTLYSRTGTAPILFNGVDPEREARLLRYTAYMESGRYPLPG
jgi:putative ABC transport system permease protein